MFTIKKLSATQTTNYRLSALETKKTWDIYFKEYVSLAGEQEFLNAIQNYPLLKGQQTNLYKCFLPLSWMIANEKGVSAYVHPDGVYDDAKGGELREELYPRLKKHFQFQNERKLFAEVANRAIYSLNVYDNENF